MRERQREKETEVGEAGRDRDDRKWGQTSQISTPEEGSVFSFYKKSLWSSSSQSLVLGTAVICSA